jgi:hypothetical protein
VAGERRRGPPLVHAVINWHPSRMADPSKTGPDGVPYGASSLPTPGGHA